MKVLKLAAGVILSGVVFGIGVYFGHNKTTPCQVEFKYINRYLACEEKPIVKKVSYLDFVQKLQGFIEVEKTIGKIDDVAIYFRDLQNGPIFGINENQLFISASLLKVPIAMSFMKLVEEDPQILSRKIIYEQIPSEIVFQDIPSKKSLTIGQEYTLEELLRQMIVYSDNNCTELVKRELQRLYPTENQLLKTYRDLGLILPQSGIDQDISVRTYSSIFRLLYNASYLSKEMSEKLLGWLVESDFPSGLIAGIPNEIPLANKFGERIIRFLGGSVERTEVQLHDCGIIYYPGNPYLLCVMTKGKDFTELSQIISTTSRMVYEEFDFRKF